jgi:hypothetical protein
MKASFTSAEAPSSVGAAVGLQPLRIRGIAAIAATQANRFFIVKCSFTFCESTVCLRYSHCLRGISPCERWQICAYWQYTPETFHLTQPAHLFIEAL